jgi:probable rRNA maturation factor
VDSTEAADPVDLVIEDARWEDAGLAALAGPAARAALAEAGLDADGVEISLLACDDSQMAALNGAHRGKPRPTNVLSWPAFALAASQPGGRPPPPPPGDGFLGDVAIAYETVMAEAAAGRIAPADHIAHLVVHAVLHLLGYDHENDADARLMEGMEVAALARLGIRDPYSNEEAGTETGAGNRT